MALYPLEVVSLCAFWHAEGKPQIGVFHLKSKCDPPLMPHCSEGVALYRHSPTGRSLTQGAFFMCLSITGRGKAGWKGWEGYKNNIMCHRGLLCTHLTHAATLLKPGKDFIFHCYGEFCVVSSKSAWSKNLTETTGDYNSLPRGLKEVVIKYPFTHC